MKSKIRTHITRTLTGWTLAWVSAFVFAASPAIAAPDETPNPETAAAVKKLLATLKVKESMEPALKGMKQMQSAMLDQQELSDEEKAAAKEIMAASMEEVEKILSWNNMESMMVRIYSKVFTTKEVTGIITLFETPAGQAYIEKQPELQAATMQEMQKMMVDLMPQIQEKTRAAVERVKAKKTQQN